MSPAGLIGSEFPALRAPGEAGGLSKDVSSLGQASFRVEPATVVFAVPALNMYLVRPWVNLSASAPAQWVVTSLNGPSQLNGGVSVFEGYLPGSAVFVAFPESWRSDTFTPHQSSGCIIGAFPASLLELSDSYPPLQYLGRADKTAMAESAIVSCMFHNFAKTNLAQNRNSGRFADTLPGDEGANSDAGPFRMLGKTVAAMGASPMARLEFDALRHTAFLSGMEMLLNGPATERGWRMDKSTVLYFDKKAYSIAGGAGALAAGVATFKTNDKGETVPVEEDQQPVYRELTLNGYLSQGELRAFALPEAGTLRRYSSSSAAQTGMFSEHRGMTGEWRVRAARSLKLSKSIFVPVPRETSGEPSQDGVFKSPQEYYDKEGVSEEDWPDMAALLQEEAHDEGMLVDWMSHFKARGKDWRIHSRDEVKKELGFADKPRKLAPLGHDKACYGLPPKTAVTDATGAVRIFYDSEAFLEMLPDGGVVIGDGYGSEIRMIKGTMTLSSAGDMRILPGRDLVVMAGGDAHINARKELNIQSATSVVRVKAETDMDLLSGNSAKGGRLLIENRSKEQGDGDPTAPDQVQSGIVIKAEKETAVMGKNIYIGLSDKNDSSGEGLSRTAKGSIIVDSCKGAFALMGGAGVVSADSFLTVACSSVNNGSALALRPGKTTLIGSVTELGTGKVTMSKAPSSFAVPVFGKEGYEKRDVKVSSGVPTLWVEGSLKVKQNGTFLGLVQGSSFRGASAAFGGASKYYSHAGTSNPPASFEVPQVSGSAMDKDFKTMQTAVEGGMQTVYNGARLAATGFSYPNTSCPYFKLVDARWQKMLAASGEKLTTWGESPVRQPRTNTQTYFYPGKKNWTSAKCCVSDLKNTHSLSDYIVQPKQESV